MCIKLKWYIPTFNYLLYNCILYILIRHEKCWLVSHVRCNMMTLMMGSCSQNMFVVGV